MNSQIVTVNLVPELSAPAVIRVSQYDVGRPLTIRVLDGTGVASFGSSVTATIVGTKPSGLGFSETGTISGSTVTLNTTLTMTQECGMIPAEISLTTSTPATVIGTANFILAVEPSPHPEGTTDGTYETMADLQTQLNGLDTRVTALETGGGGSGLTDDIKTALLQIAEKVAYIDAHGQDYYDDLYEALNGSSTRSVLLVLSHVSSSNTQSTVEVGDSYTTTLTASTNYTLNTVSVSMGGVDVTATTYSSGTVSIPSVTGNIVITATAVLAAQSITATYTQSGTVYDTDSLDSLKADLVVTANYAGGTSETVPASDYTLSGTLTAGTSTITVSYAGLTTTFNVTVTHLSIEYLYNWDLTSSLVDSVSSQEITLSGNPTRDSSGLHFTAAAQLAILSDSLDMIGKTIELDIASFDFKGDTSKHARLLMTANTTYGTGPLIFRSNTGWTAYGWVSASAGTSRAWASTGYGDLYASNQINAFNSKTVKIVFTDGHTFSVYVDGTLAGTVTDVYLNDASSRSEKVIIGGITSSTSASNGDQCYDMTITGIRIWANS